MLLDFSYEQVMRMSNVKRWGIITMSRPQSVAEHSFNVACIALAIAEEIEWQALTWTNAMITARVDKKLLMRWCLLHDLPEVVTGDIPTPLKKMVGGAIESFESKLFPEHSALKAAMQNDHELEYMLYKIADYSDAIQFARSFCIDTKKDEIIREMVSAAGRLIDQVDKVYFKEMAGHRIRSVVCIDVKTP